MKMKTIRSCFVNKFTSRLTTEGRARAIASAPRGVSELSDKFNTRKFGLDLIIFTNDKIPSTP